MDLATPVDDYITAQQIDTALEAPVTREKALSVEAVLRGRNLICSLATLPLVQRDKAGKFVESPLLQQMDQNVPNIVVKAMLVEDLVFEGIAWCRAVDWDAQGYPTKITKLDVNTVSLQPPRDVSKGLRTLPSGAKLPVGTVWIEGKPEPVTETVNGKTRVRIIRFDSPNPGVRKAAARAINRLLLLEATSARYADNPAAQEYFTPQDGADPAGDAEIKEILSTWKAARKKGGTGYVPAALKHNTIDRLTPVELQIIQMIEKAEKSIANAMGLDPEDLGISTTSRTYNNAVDRRKDRINDILSPYMLAITDRLSMGDITRRGHTVSFNVDDYLKADPLTRWQTHKIAVELYAKDVAEVRNEEDMDPNPELEERAKKARTAPAPRPADELAERRAAASAPLSAAFSRPDGEAKTHDTVTFAISDDQRAEFSADLEARTVTGLLVPWNKVAASGWSKWLFKKDSLKWTDASRVKLNREHDRRTATGYAKKLWAKADGLYGTFKVARGERGDEMLILAEDGVLDGFSIEVDFESDGSSWARDPDDDMVRVVTSAFLSGCALTSAPAFDDARLTGVKASRNTDRKDGPMPEENTPNGVGTIELSAEASAAFAKVMADGMAGQTEKFGELVQQLIDAQQKPEVVDGSQARGTQQFHVTEEPVYRFDGIRGKHDFSSDLVAANKNQDGEALKRAQDFISENFSNREMNKRIAQYAADFAVTTANVATLNPSVNRPDMYVDQLQYPTPIWDAIRKGSIADNTPFVLPKFNTSSGLVADHVQGVEPTPGALTTTSQTITPSAVSGKVEVTREAWDQGGNPQLSTILWRQMVRAWDEALEQGAAALLEGLTVTTITLTDGAEDDVLVDEVTGAIVDLHFIRGGFRFQDFFLEKGLYKKLAQAKDADGRKLLPILGPQNADGSAGPLMASLNVAGLAGRPAWALPYTTNVESDSYIFNREDVHGWASAPTRLDFEYRVAFVDVAIWGYKAFACTRTDGVRKFAYDDNAGA